MTHRDDAGPADAFDLTNMRRTLAALAFCAALTAGTAAAQSAKVVQLVVAAAPGWTTDVVAVDDNTDPSNNILLLSDCAGGSVTSLRLLPGGADIARNIAGGAQLCDLRGKIGLLPVVTPGSVETHLTLHDPITGLTSFLLVPALDAALQKRGDRVRATLIANAHDEQAWLVVFGDPGPLTVEVYNNQQHQVSIQFLDAPQFQPNGWRLMIVPLTGAVDLGEVRVTEGDTSAPLKAIPDRTYYGFVIVSNADGTPRYVRAWQPMP